MGELDLSSLYMSAIALLVLIVAVLLYSPPRKGDRLTITNDDLLSEVKKLRQDMEAKFQTMGATDSILNEVRELRQDLESKLQGMDTATGATENVLDEVKAMRQDLRSKYERTNARDSVLDEVKKLRTEFESRFGTKFSNQGFTADEAYPLFLAINRSLTRFDDDIRSGLVSNVTAEAKGHVAILRLILSWAQANDEEGVRMKAEESLKAAQGILDRASHL